MSAMLKAMLDDDTGATAIEYALLAALIGVAMIAGAATLGNSLNNSFQNTHTNVDTALQG